VKHCIPAYIHWSDDVQWDRLLATIRPGDIAVVTGPASGPPTEPADRTALAARIAQLRTASAIVVGYVAWGYGHKRAPVITEELHQWHRMAIDGAWIDEAPASYDPVLRRTAQGLHGYVRSWRPHPDTKMLRGLSCWNPGTWEPGINDIMRSLPASLWCTVECAAADYPGRATDRRSSWPLREIHLAHTAHTAEHAHDIERLMAKVVGWGYATNDGPDGNPWDTVRP